MIMFRSSCGMFSSETCLMATKSPFSRSSPLYTRPYAPFPISSPSICRRAPQRGRVGERSPSPKNSQHETRITPGIQGVGTEDPHVFVVERLGFVELRIMLPRRHLVAPPPKLGAGRGRGGRISSHRRRVRGSCELARRGPFSSP
jgi:hypothetical protein